MSVVKFSKHHLFVADDEALVLRIQRRAEKSHTQGFAGQLSFHISMTIVHSFRIWEKPHGVVLWHLMVSGGL